MHIFITIVLFTCGLILIVLGGNVLVKNAIKISEITGIPEVLVGATIVSLATTLPELSVTVFSSLDNVSSLAVGNAVGSVIFNLFFILGFCLFISPQKVDTRNIKKNFYILLFTIVALIIFGATKFLNIWSGIFLIAICAYFFIMNVKNAVKEIGQTEVVLYTIPANYKSQLLMVVIGFIFGSSTIAVGAKALVVNGELLTRFIGLSEHVVGITFIAIGTSLPELVTAFNGIRLKATNIAIGTTLGANILSTTLLLGTLIILNGGQLSFHPSITFFALPFILLSIFIIYLPIAIKGRTYKTQGVTLLILFFIYYLVLFL